MKKNDETNNNFLNTPIIKGETIIFGEYPQSLYKGNIPTDLEKNEDGYFYIYGNKVEKVGNLYYKVEPIEWCVFNNNGIKHIMSKNILDCSVMSNGKKFNYEKSILRAFFNNEFINKAFTKEQQELIKESNIDGLKDKIYTLSEEEIEELELNFISSATLYAIKKGCRYKENRASEWWSRTKASGHTDSGCVVRTKEIVTSTYYMSVDFNFGVRPVFVFNEGVTFNPWELIKEECNKSKDSDTILFGEYPKSLYTGVVNLDVLPDKQGVYHVNDLKLKKIFDKFHIIEPIEWNVVNINGKEHLVSKNILDFCIFHTMKNDYESSELRSFLNGTFFCNAFSLKEQEKIQVSNIDGLLDKVYVLSEEEISNVSIKTSKVTDYCLNQNCFRNNKNNGKYWLRTKNNKITSFASIVNEFGNIDGEYVTAQHEEYIGFVGVRPVISFEKDKIINGKLNKTIVDNILPNETEEGIEFGYYPTTRFYIPNLKQKKIEESSDGFYYCYNEKQEKNGYYYFIDEKFIKINDYFIRIEPIIWNEVELEGEKYLLAKYVLDGIAFESSIFEEGELRNYLNSEFINKAFTKEQQNLLGSLNSLNDKVSILSKSEYFEIETRCVQSTGLCYVKNIDGSKDTKPYSSYWLRSNVLGTKENYFIDKSGRISRPASYSVNKFIRGIRPMIKLNGESTSKNMLIKNDYYTRIGKHIVFGEYPQSIYYGEIPDDLTIDSNGYYHFNNYKLKKHTSIYGKEDFVIVESIKWTVVEINGEEHIVSNIVLDTCKYDNDCNYYETSNIRNVLNNEFINNAFTKEQQDLIEVSKVDKFSDKIYILNSKQFEFLEIKTTQSSEYAILNGLNPLGLAQFWLLNPNNKAKNKVKYVTSKCEIEFNVVDATNVGYRPILKLKLNK
ncbi:MAG: DUF6273 domain-containing protein, partial [bacterium]